MYGLTNYMNSITVKKLQTFYGPHFYNLVKPWHYKTRSTRPLDSHRAPHIIGGGIEGGESHIINVSRQPTPLFAASNSSNDNETSTGISGAGYVYIEGVDYFYKKKVEFVKLDGQNAVTLEHQYRNINKAVIAQYAQGANYANPYYLGIIDIGSGNVSSGSLSKPYIIIEAEDSIAAPRQYGLHDDELVFITKIDGFSTNNSTGMWSLWIQTDKIPLGKDVRRGYTLQSSHVHEAPATRIVSGTFNNGRTSIDFNEPLQIDPGSTLYFTLDSSDKLTSISMMAQGFVFENVKEYQESSSLKQPNKFKMKMTDQNRRRMHPKERMDKKTKKTMRNPFYRMSDKK